MIVPPLTVLTTTTSQPLFAPTGAKNARKCACARCGARLPAGQARQWDWTTGVYLINARPKYYCRACHEHKLALLAQEPELRAALAEIEAWARQNVNLNMGWHAARQVEQICRACGLAAADVARRIADRLDDLPEFSYPAVVALARRCTRQALEDYDATA